MGRKHFNYQYAILLDCRKAKQPGALIGLDGGGRVFLEQIALIWIRRVQISITSLQHGAPNLYIWTIVFQSSGLLSGAVRVIWEIKRKEVLL